MTFGSDTRVNVLVLHATTGYRPMEYAPPKYERTF